MPAILGLETSTDVCSAAIHEGDSLVAEVVIHEPQAHASRLALLIEEVVKKANITYSELTAVAVSAGPGSYTGLRIGTSTAKGLCYALNIPLLSVGTLELLAYQGKALAEGSELICPMIDARRMEVYCMVVDRNLGVLEGASARVIDEESFSELLQSKRMLFVGNGAGKCRNVIRHSNASFAGEIFPSAGPLCELAKEKLVVGQFEDLIHFKPFYLKEFIARTPGSAV